MNSTLEFAINRYRCSAYMWKENKYDENCLDKRLSHLNTYCIELRQEVEKVNINPNNTKSMRLKALTLTALDDFEHRLAELLFEGID
jgi:hypothetical protein